jgi:sec-independent protein translocase protein TatA
MFDPSAPHIIILLVVVLLLFGSTRLPGAAKALGQSMHIFKKSVKGLEEDKPADTVTVPPPAALAAPPPPQPNLGQDATQQQLQDLQRQLRELQEQQSASAGSAPVPSAQLSEAQRNQQTS